MTTATSRRFITSIQDEFGYCITCQPFEGGEPVWILGERTPLTDLLAGHEVPQELWQQVASALRCPNCGAVPDACDDVGLLSEYERAVRQFESDWRKRWKKKFEDFHEHLERLPYLGLTHQIGRSIKVAIQSLPPSEIRDQVWFRARAIADSTIPGSCDFWPPDPGKSQVSEGRYNHHGQAIFYMADSADAAALEVLGTQTGVVWVQQFTIHSLTPVLDLAPDLLADPDPSLGLVALALAHTGVLRRSVNRSTSWKPEYFLPRFVADCARSAGFKALVFASHCSMGRCLAAFEWSTDNVRVKGKPKLRRLAFRKGTHASKRGGRA